MEGLSSLLGMLNPPQGGASNLDPLADLVRHDGSMKGTGWFGPLKNSLDQDVTEFSIGLNFGEGDVDVPTLVPTLTPEEVQQVLDVSAGNGQLSDAIIQKAGTHARMRMDQGLSPFSVSGDLGQQSTMASGGK